MPAEPGVREAEQQREPRRVRLGEVPVGDGGGADSAGEVIGSGGVQRGGERGGHLLKAVDHEGGQQLVAVGEVAVQRRSRHTHVPGDVGEAKIGSVLSEHPARRRLDLLDRGGPHPVPAGGRLDRVGSCG